MNPYGVPGVAVISEFIWSCGEEGCMLLLLLVSVFGPSLNKSICYHEWGLLSRPEKSE